MVGREDMEAAVKPREDLLAFVQFIHPGKEQTNVDERGWVGWNCAKHMGAWPHRRKFLLCRSHYLKDGEPKRGEVGLWGEWEPPSFTRPISYVASDEHPNLFHIPAFFEPKEYDGRLDTDPFIYGKQFLYTGCQQHTNHKKEGGAVETFLRRLSIGSVILFGSSVSRRFVLDTVFVVGGFVDYPRGDYAKLDGLGIPREFYVSTLIPSAAGNPTVDSFRLYFGATRRFPVAGMFSFSPCASVKEMPDGFPRLPVTLDGLVTPSMSQGKKGTALDLDQMAAAWQSIRNQVEAAGLSLAHQVELDPIPLEVKDG